METVCAVRQNSELNLAKMGAQVTGMRRTRDGYLLVELTKGVGSVEAAQKLSSSIAIRLGEAVGAVSHLGQYAVVDIVDFDAVASEGKVHATLRSAIPGAADDQTAIYDRQAVQITDLWSTRSGQKIATTRMTSASASAVTRIPNCRWCGESGYEQKQCKADKDRCMVCERAGFVRFTHEPGSIACKARSEALKPANSGAISGHLQ
ncbi:hypothetical protein QTP88_015841 [Uroleucon formosanum]